MEQNKKNLIDLLRWLIISICVIVFFTFVLQVAYIPSNSMNPYLYEGDYCLLNRLSKNYNRYDIVTFKPPVKGKEPLFIKRIIGLPGETIIIKEGHVYLAKNIDDSSTWEKLDESFILEEMNPDEGEGIYIIPEDAYLLLGDNRNNSYDARFWPSHYVKKEDISAKLFIRFPIAKAHRK